MEEVTMTANATKRWYVVHAYSGFEKSVQKALLDRISRAGMQEKFGKILVPTEEVVEMKGGQKNISERKFFPGYVLVEIDITDDAWHLVKNTPKVTGFVGAAHNEQPPPISDAEVTRLTTQLSEGTLKPKPRVQFDEGDTVRVIDGPFANFNGTVEEVNPEKVKEELADVLTFAFLLAEKYNFNIKQIILDKMAKNDEKYPVDKAKGTARKYNEL